MKKFDYIKIFEAMHMTRFSQEYLMEIYHPEDKMKCPIHFCKGQEALAACLSLFLKKNDYVLSHHRSHGYYLAKGCSLDELIGELYGKISGSNKGLAVSQDISSSKDNFYAGAILSGSVAYTTRLGKVYIWDRKHTLEIASNLFFLKNSFNFILLF